MDLPVVSSRRRTNRNVAALAEEVRAAIGQTLTRAYADRGYAGEKLAQRTPARQRIESHPSVVLADDADFVAIWPAGEPMPIASRAPLKLDREALPGAIRLYLGPLSGASTGKVVRSALHATNPIGVTRGTL